MRDILILQLGRLGDLVQTLPLIRRCKEVHPGCRVTLVCLEAFQAVIGEAGGWDRLVPVSLADTDRLADPEQAAAFPDLPPFDGIAEFREDYDLVVTLNPDLGSAVLCQKIRAARKLGRIHTYEGELRLLGPWAKYLFAMVSQRTGNLFNLVDLHMGLAGLQPGAQPPCLPVPAARGDEARELLRQAGWRGGHPLVALQTGASDLHRAWDVEHFAELAAALIDEGAEIVLLGDGRETDRAEELRSRLGRPLVDLVGKTGLALLPAVVKACDLLVSNDTGTIHVAAAVGTPTLGLFFSTAYFTETAPYGAGHAVLQVEIPCAPCSASRRCEVQSCRQHLTVPEVLRTARWLLRPGSEPPELPPTLALYRSRFLANGTLLYAPVDGKPSAHYQAGLLGRLVWEGALDIPRDAFLEECWRRAEDGEDWSLRRRELGETLDRLAGPLDRGLDLAGRLRGAFASGRTEMVQPLHGQLAALGKSLSDTGARSGLFGDYLRYEMMDMDFAPYPELAALLEEKYRSLTGWIGRVRASLARV